ncbi:hypothetical protein BO94DRAFT_555460 [Aspergillus sclerotioniger CBS 115572]|uniref:Uncharacterized protein n=1 Tax=Aspergillus sclerotioniger CBS 115572 TaxID=1450535 RepID=A0A317X0F9_9EURO|nr:hypothetical protein BO94DRAFT_555460 [Aspergillus sclerotioniger CBS 115572]PWY91651.1 hypothetical protein BO94DRAFT_555460 [Aspergillus sclerotioniger CBS 115572]
MLANAISFNHLPGTDDAILPFHATALNIMHILKSYSVNCKDVGTVAEDMRTFLPRIMSYIEKQEPIRMVLPAFPFKSPNYQDKTLGVLPDLAEELALHHLNGLCLNISRVYKHGAEVHITSNGLVYNKLTIHFRDPSFSPDAAIKTDINICLTYRGYIKFLTKDLAQKVVSKSKRAQATEIAQTARSMIVQGQMFAAAIQAQRGNYVQLSIHESAKGRKLSVPLIPQKQGIISHTPWHSCVAVGVNSFYRATHVNQVRDTHDLAENGLQIQFEHLYPCGLIIRPFSNTSQSPSLRSLPMRKIRQLSCHMSPVICCGFSDTNNKDIFVDKAAELGKVTAWSQDIIVKVRDSKRQDKNNNNIKSNEAMPMHFDGMFRLEYKTDPTTGETNRGMDNDGFWDTKIYNLPLVIPYPHQPWTVNETKFSTCNVTIHNDNASLIPQIDDLTYNYRDVLINDNISILHTRTVYTSDCD